jgi:hypothetical protein
MRETVSLSKIAKALLITVVIAIIVSAGTVGIIMNSRNHQSSTTTSGSSSTSTSNSRYSSEKPVGVFYYLWYGYNYTTGQWPGGFVTSHWNDSSTGIVSDKPIQGYYSMMNNATLSSQIVEMEQSGIDFAVISWWGWGVYNFTNPISINRSAAAINNATANLFRLVTSDFPSFKLAIMVDAFSKGPVSFQNYSSIYEYVNDNYYSKYPNTILKNETSGKPYLFWFNPLDPYNSNLNQSFVNEIVGNSRYVNVTLWRAPNSDLQGEYDQILSNYEGNPNISTTGIVSILPRYDDRDLYVAGGRSSYMQFDISYNESLYQTEWNYVLNNSNHVSMVLIYSWNEYHERSAIEPHYDNTSSVSPFYLTDLTKYYVTKLQGLSPEESNFSIYQPNFNFQSALDFYSTKLYTSLGLLSTTSGSTTIYLSDDQALDYDALLDIYHQTNNLSALTLANQVNSSVQSYGGLYYHWNGVFVLFGDYKTPWNFSSGSDITIGTNGKYTIKSTIFNYPMGPENTAKYADLELYYAAYNIEIKNYSGAENAFVTANRLWDGFGFVDAAYNTSYTSYKLGLDIMVWKMLKNASQTQQFAIQYSPALNQVLRIFSALQGSDGGVCTNYVVSNGSVMPAGQENGETTSLFVLSIS